MNRWSLRTRFGLAAACLSVAALGIGLLVLRPLVYRTQIKELDEQLAGNAEELFRDIENFRGAPQDFRKPVSERLVPAVLRGRYLQINGPEGQLLYRSANLRGRDLSGIQEQHATVMIADRESRIGTFEHGFLRVHIGTRLGTIEAMQEDLRNATLMVAPVMGVLVFAVGWLLGNRALRPVAALSAAAERIDASNPEARLPLLDASSEIAAMTEVLNRSFDRLQRAYASAARFSADASHQLRTPLAVMRAGLDGLMAQPGLPAGVAVELEGLMKQTRRLTTLTSDLLLLAQIDAGRLKLEPGRIDLAELGRAVVDDLEVQAGARGLEVVSELPEVLPALGDARRVAIILQNLGENAVKYAGEGGRIVISGGCGADGVSVRVANTGPAIPEEHRAHLFDRFYRAASGEDVKGHGLGLNIAQGLARAQNGELELMRSDGEWTEFVLRLPAEEVLALG